MNNPNEVFFNLFKALDDTVLAEYINFQYGEGLVDFPSEMAIEALENYCKMFNQKSEALEAMQRNGQ